MVATPRTDESPAPDPIRVRPWPDPVIDTLGHDPRSLYVERFWLPTLGPTTLVLLRHLAHRFERAGSDTDADDADTVVDLPVSATARTLGLGPRDGRNSPLRRSLARLVQFGLAHPRADATLSVRRSVPPVNRRHVRRLPDELEAEHDAWVHHDTHAAGVSERHACGAALTLVELGGDVDAVERALRTLGFPPRTCRDAAVWARAAHRRHDRETARPTPAPDGERAERVSIP